MHGQAAQSAGSPALLQMMGGLHHKTIPGQVPSQNYTWTGSLFVAKMLYCLHFPMRALPTCCTVCTFSCKALPKCCTVCTFPMQHCPHALLSALSQYSIAKMLYCLQLSIQHCRNAVLSAVVHTAWPKCCTVCSFPIKHCQNAVLSADVHTALPQCCTVCSCPCSIAKMLCCLHLRRNKVQETRARVHSLTLL